jgi:hypothetical protein
MHFKTGLCLLALSLALPAQAQSLWLFSGDAAWHLQPEQAPVLRHAKVPELADHFTVTRKHGLVYSNIQDDWLHFDLKTGKKNVLLKRGALSKVAFPEVYPEPQPDGSYYAKAIFPNSISIFRLVSGKAPQRILPRPDLYAFEPLPQGGYVFVTQERQGQESPDFIDYIVGKKMRLWHQPPTGKARQLGAFDTIHTLRVVDQGRQVVFFTPGKTQGATLTWKLLRVPLQGGPAQAMAELVKPASTRTAPLMATWTDLDWVVYADTIRDLMQDHVPLQFMRQRLGQAAQPWFTHRSTTFRHDSWSPDGYLSRPRRQQGKIQVMECWSVRSGEKVAEYEYDWDQINPGYALCSDS